MAGCATSSNTARWGSTKRLSEPCGHLIRRGVVNNSTRALAAEVFDAMNTGQLERPAILTFVTTVLQVRYEVQDVVAAGDMVAIRATAHGVNAMVPQGIEPTYRSYAMKTAHFFRSRDGRLCEHWGVRDELDVLYQIGALKPQEIPMPVPD